METEKQWSSFVTKDDITALKLFTVVVMDDEDGNGLKFEKISCVLKKSPKSHYGFLSLINFT